MLIWYNAVAQCLSVCVSITCQSSIETVELIELVFDTGYPGLILHCIKREFGYLQNNGSSLRNLVSNSELSPFSAFLPRHINHRKCCQFSYIVIYLLL